MTAVGQLGPTLPPGHKKVAGNFMVDKARANQLIERLQSDQYIVRILISALEPESLKIVAISPPCGCLTDMVLISRHSMISIYSITIPYRIIATFRHSVGDPFSELVNPIRGAFPSLTKGIRVPARETLISFSDPPPSFLLYPSLFVLRGIFELKLRLSCPSLSPLYGLTQPLQQQPQRKAFPL
jgi:hypothetical protein